MGIKQAIFYITNVKFLENNLNSAVQVYKQLAAATIQRYDWLHFLYK